jgi:glycerate dehydrogenase
MGVEQGASHGGGGYRVPIVNIVFLDRGTIGPGVALRPPGFEHRWENHERTRPEQVVERLADADIAITNKVPITAAALGELPRLRFVAVAATGTNIVDLEACRERGIPVSNIQGYAATTVSEHTFAMILALRRNLFQYREEVIGGVWQAAEQYCYFNRPIHDLAGSVLGIVGTGAIASAVSSLGRAFGMRVRHHSLSGRTDVPGFDLVGVDELFATADVLSLHCPLTDASRGLVNLGRLRQMKRGALLVNTARGEIVDLDHLEQALVEGLIGGAAIDVSPVEPPPFDSPLMRLSRRHDFLLTPHTAWASVEAMQVLADQLIDNLEAFVAGEPQHVVN